MATVAYGVASFTSGGAETASFSWVNALTGAPVTFVSTPVILFGPCQTVLGGMGAGVPYLDGAGAITTSGGTITCASPPSCLVVMTAIGT